MATAKRVSTVELQVKGRKQSFEISHAERILKMPNNGGWSLPDSSNFNFDLKNGLTVKPNKGASTKPKKSSGNK